MVTSTAFQGPSGPKVLVDQDAARGSGMAITKGERSRKISKLLELESAIISMHKRTTVWVRRMINGYNAAETDRTTSRDYLSNKRET